MSMYDEPNGWKLWTIGTFFSAKGIALPKIIQMEIISKMTCIFYGNIYIMN